jgi:hypothetical protein
MKLALLLRLHLDLLEAHLLGVLPLLALIVIFRNQLTFLALGFLGSIPLNTTNIIIIACVVGGVCLIIVFAVAVGVARSRKNRG